jgi:hypothetical protein
MLYNEQPTNKSKLATLVLLLVKKSEILKKFNNFVFNYHSKI